MGCISTPYETGDKDKALIDAHRCYTLEAVTDWGLNPEGKKRATVAAHGGKDWIEGKKGLDPDTLLTTRIKGGSTYRGRRYGGGLKEWAKSRG